MSRSLGVLAAIALLTLPLWLASPYHLHVVIMAGIFTILALSLNLLLGYTGQLSLGHAGFFGIGAYTSALLALKADRSFWIGLPSAALAAGLAGWGIGREEGVSNAAPHARQKRASAGSSVPQRAQRTAIAFPHERQNLACPGFS